MWCIAPAALKVGTMNDLIALAKQRNAQGQPLSFGPDGNGTTQTARRPISARKHLK